MSGQLVAYGARVAPYAGKRAYQVYKQRDNIGRLYTAANTIRRMYKPLRGAAKAAHSYRNAKRTKFHLKASEENSAQLQGSRQP
jgi:hypothetical protein